MLIGTQNSGEKPGTGATPQKTAWDAPLSTAPLNVRLPLPGSKSLTGRELLLAALANGPGTIRGALKSRDSDLMIAALRALGTEIHEQQDAGERVLSIHPAKELLGPATIDCGLAGTVMRFVPPVAALALGPIAFDGDPYARKRPMAPLITALRQLGVEISDDGRGALPFTVHGMGKVAGGECEIDASLSSQFVSALLLAAPRFTAGVTIRHSGERIPSLPHIEMTIASLRARGVTVDTPAPCVWQVQPGEIAAADSVIEPDLSNAAPFLAAALVAGGSVTIPRWPAATTQVGDMLRTLLPQFGGAITHSAAGDCTITAAKQDISPVTMHIPEAGELAPTLVGLAALAGHLAALRGDAAAVSEITGIGHIRHHETDRIAALVTEINGLGGKATELSDGIRIEPAELSGGSWHAYADHRMATTGALLGLLVPGVQIDDIACTAKTLPDFPELWQRLLNGAA